MGTEPFRELQDPNQRKHVPTFYPEPDCSFNHTFAVEIDAPYLGPRLSRRLLQQLIRNHISLGPKESHFPTKDACCMQS